MSDLKTVSSIPPLAVGGDPSAGKVAKENVRPEKEAAPVLTSAPAPAQSSSATSSSSSSKLLQQRDLAAELGTSTHGGAGGMSQEQLYLFLYSALNREKDEIAASLVKSDWTAHERDSHLRQAISVLGQHQLARCQSILVSEDVKFVLERAAMMLAGCAEFCRQHLDLDVIRGIDEKELPAFQRCTVTLKPHCRPSAPPFSSSSSSSLTGNGNAMVADADAAHRQQCPSYRAHCNDNHVATPCPMVDVMMTIVPKHLEYVVDSRWFCKQTLACPSVPNASSEWLPMINSTSSASSLSCAAAGGAPAGFTFPPAGQQLNIQEIGIVNNSGGGISNNNSQNKRFCASILEDNQNENQHQNQKLGEWRVMSDDRNKVRIAFLLRVRPKDKCGDFSGDFSFLYVLEDVRALIAAMDAETSGAAGINERSKSSRPASILKEKKKKDLTGATASSVSPFRNMVVVVAAREHVSQWGSHMAEVTNGQCWLWDGLSPLF
jgi:hypothetical protein